MKKLLVLAGIIAISSLASCSSDDEPKVEDLGKAKEISISPAEIRVLNGARSRDLSFLQAASAQLPDKNMVVSSWGSLVSVAMLSNGMTEPELSALLQSLDAGSVDELNKFAVKISEALEDLDPKHAELLSSNAFWYDQSYTLAPGIRKIWEGDYDTDISTLDFKTSSTKASDVILSWVRKTSKDKLNTLPVEITSATAGVLANMQYFKGQWRNAFSKKDTRKEDFVCADGSKHKVDMMRHTLDEGRYDAEVTDAYTWVKVPYGTGAFEAVFIMPSKGVSPDEFIGSQDFGDVFNRTSSYGYTRTVSLPRFKIEPVKTDLDAVYRKMGVPVSSFSGLDGTPYPLTHAQLATIEVDESGTEAAAVTMTDIAWSAGEDRAPTVYPEIVIDRAFVFLIREASTRLTIFSGKVNSL